MSMLARYKKGGGIIELVKLVEDSAEPKRSQLMTMIRNEDADFASRVEGRLFSYEKLKALPESILAEIMATTPVKYVAAAVWGEDPAFVSLCEKCVAKNYNEYKAEKEALTATPPGAGQIEAARRKLISEARKLEASGAIKLPFSEGTGLGASAAGTEGAAPRASSSGGAALPLPGNAHESDGVPALATFGLEVPPPGLSGERLQNFLKTNLGF